MLDRLRRVTDLFVEGTERYLGMDGDGKPILIWVNKLNSFEVEEARRDGLARRGERILSLTKPDSPERLAVEATIAAWTDEQLRVARVEQLAEDIYLDVINELDGDEEWREKLATMRRLPTLLNDQRAPEDDPRRQELLDLQTSYLNELRARQDKQHRAKLDDLSGLERAVIERDFLEAWRNRVSLDDFMEEKRVTELFYALRDCKGTERGRSSDGTLLWDHTNCNHAARLCSDRAEVRLLPEAVIEMAVDTLDDITVPQRESGNSDAPPSSSGSSEQSSAPEVSSPSIPMETPSAVPMI